MGGEDPRLERFSEICTGLPEAERELSAKHAIFRVRRRTFAYYLDDHHGDGIVGITAKSPSGRNEELIAAAPDRYYMPAYLGPRGWVALRLDLAEIDWDEVGGLAIESYLMTAPKKLAAQVISG